MATTEPETITAAGPTDERPRVSDLPRSGDRHLVYAPGCDGDRGRSTGGMRSATRGISAVVFEHAHNRCHLRSLLEPSRTISCILQALEIKSVVVLRSTGAQHFGFDRNACNWSLTESAAVQRHVGFSTAGIRTSESKKPFPIRPRLSGRVTLQYWIEGETMTTVSRALPALVLVCASVWAQAPTAQITGTVKDSSGAAVPGAAVKATETAAGVDYTATCGADGRYKLSGLPAGPYTLEVSKDGLRKFVQTGIVLEGNASPTIDVVLQPGEVPSGNPAAPSLGDLGFPPLRPRESPGSGAARQAVAHAEGPISGSA